MINEDGRQLVTIREVDELIPIDGADKIELARFAGWQCVVKIGEFAVGDKALYFEIDSMLPADDPRFEFLKARGTKKRDEKEYCRLRTIRLRGQLSQGLALPLSLFPEIESNEDVDWILGVIKYEPVMFGKSMPMDAKGEFPSYIKKTDAERIQNISWKTIQTMLDTEFEVTVKLDGSSMTAFHYNDDENGVCSRNVWLKTDNENKNNFVEMYEKYNLQKALALYGRPIAVQGELIAPDIQSNYEKVSVPEYRVFSIWDIETQKYMSRMERQIAILELKMLGADLLTAPVIEITKTLREIVGNENCQDEKTFRDTIMAMADGASLNHDQREGIVFKSVGGLTMFKVISNAYLERER